MKNISTYFFAIFTTFLIQNATPALAEQQLQTKEEKPKKSFILLDTGFGISIGRKIYWDIDLDGFAEAIAWPEQGGFIAIDKDGDQIINSTELFNTNESNGIKALEKDDSNHDHKIDKSDKIWPHLLVWQDLNHNGQSEKDELSTVSQLKIQNISLEAAKTNEKIKGNSVPYKSSYTKTAVDGSYQTLNLIEVEPEYNDVNTVYTSGKIDLRTLFLPTLRGYGTLPDLHYAMSIDNKGAGNLFEKIFHLQQTKIEKMVNAPEVYNAKFQDIIYRWAKADQIDIDSRGPNIDARQLLVLEKFSGEAFSQTGAGGTKNPLFWGALDLNHAYNLFFNNTYGALTAQIYGKDIFIESVPYDIMKGGFERISALNLTKLEEIGLIISKISPTERKSAWKNIIRMLEYSVSLKNISEADKEALDTIIRQSDRTLSLNAILWSVTSPDIRYMPGHDYADKVLKLKVSDGDIIGLAKEARRRDNGKQIVYSNLATDYFKTCCNNKDEIFHYLKENGFKIIERPVNIKLQKNFGIEFPYDQVYWATVSMSSWDSIKRNLSMPNDQIMLVLFMNKNNLQWSYAQVQRW